MQKKIRVLATGRFDVIHPGHVAYLYNSKKLGDELFVIVASEATVDPDYIPIIPLIQRVKMVEALKPVDFAIAGSSDKSKMLDPVKEINPDIITIGYDQNQDPEQLEKVLKKEGIDVKVVRIPKTGNYRFTSTRSVIDEVLRRKRNCEWKKPCV